MTLTAVRYLAEDPGNPKAAVRFMDEFDRPVGLTCAYPETHALSPLPELAGFGYRPMRAMNYIALYKVVDGTVVVAHIFHGRQDYARMGQCYTKNGIALASVTESCGTSRSCPPVLPRQRSIVSCFTPPPTPTRRCGTPAPRSRRP